MANLTARLNQILSQILRSLTAAEAQTRHSSKKEQQSNCLRYLDVEAIVEKTIQPGKTGQVRFRGSWWRARCEQEIALNPGDVVYVIDRYNLMLLVTPASSTNLTQSDITPRV